MRLFCVLLCFVPWVYPSTACPSDDTNLQSFKALYPSTTTSTDVVITDSRLLDVTSLDVNTIVISGSGRLVFNPGNDIYIRTNSIRIQDNAELIIGSEDCRFEDQVDIILKGTRTADRSGLTERGEKFISVEDNASLMIFGKDKPAWTKLTATRNMPAADYQHSKDPSVNTRGRFQEGLAVTVFDASLSRQDYVVYDLFKNNVDREQRQVDQMVEDLNGLPDGFVVAVALQIYRRHSEGLDLSALYNTVETLAGMQANTLAFRNSGKYDAFALVFQKGSATSNQAIDRLVDSSITEARASIEVNGRKVSAVSTIEIGKKRASSVDFLVLPLDEGYPVLFVVHDISKWEVGDSVVITSTDYSWKHAEVRRIKAIVNPNAVQLDHEMKYRHFGEIENRVDMRAEMGLLTRNIKIRGELQTGCPEENGNCNQFDYDTYGGHIKTIRSFGNLHIEGVELFHAGQPTDKGFYPIHFHMCGDVTDKEAVIRRNSIHHTFQRAVVVHGTYGTSETQLGVEISENVAYSVLGHAFFEEDGAERATSFRGNLAVSVQCVNNGFFSTDANKPTAFWITTPETVLVDNVAAGGEGFGIWHTFPEIPVGESATLGIYRRRVASRTPLYTTDNNVAHSNEKGGMNFDNVLENADGDVAGCMRYNPLVDPNDRRSEPSPVFLYRFTGYKNRLINLWLRGGGFVISQCSLAESRRGVQLATGGPQHQYLQDCVIMGESEGNNEAAEGYPDAYSNGAAAFDHYKGVVMYDGPIWVSNIFFYGFKPNPVNSIKAGAIGFHAMNKFTSSIVSTVRNLQFGDDDGTGMNRVFDGTMDEDSINGFGNFAGDELPTFRDGDGSVVQCPDQAAMNRQYQLIKPEKFLETDRAVYRPNWNMAWSTDMYAKIALFVEEDEQDFVPVRQAKRINRKNPNDVAYETSTRDKNRAFMAVLNRTDDYYYQFQIGNGFPAEINVVGQGIDREGDVIVGICLPEGTTKDDMTVRTFTPSSHSFSNADSGIVWVDDMETLAQDTTMSRALLQGRFLYVHFSSALVRDTAWDAYDDDHCPGGVCPSLRIIMNDGNSNTYQPCFTPTETDLATAVNAGRTEECVLKKGVRDESWGAGDTLAAHDGQLREWSSWTECCNESPTSIVTQTRTRTCNFPTPHNGGADCNGARTQTRQCTTSCPVDGSWTGWSRWADCTCFLGSSGVKTRTRSCDGVANGGEYCRGSSSESTTCEGNCS